VSVLATGAMLVSACSASDNSASSTTPAPTGASSAASGPLSTTSSTTSRAPATTSSGAPVTMTTAANSTASSTAATSFAPGDPGVGAPGIGDPYYPLAGNGGYEVDGYDLDLTYLPESNELSGTATITATVTNAVALERFDLDLQPTMSVSTITVDGAAASSVPNKAELVVTPAAPLAVGSHFTAVVTYSGRPGYIDQEDQVKAGWYRTPTGGAVAVGEPFSASAWYPVNEHPADPAAFALTMTVPSKWKVMSIGTAQPAPTAPAGSTAYRWVEKKPVASYLTSVYVDTFSTSTSRTSGGIPIVNAFADVADRPEYVKIAALTGNALDVLQGYFGPYPYETVGGMYTGIDATFALEVATRPVYADWLDVDTLVHELTHQWYGDSVTIRRWADICLNECFATYGPWLYAEKTQHKDLDAMWRDRIEQYGGDPAFWASPLYDPGAGKEFDAVYARGALAMHALRKEMGDAKFFALLKGWATANAGKLVSFDEFQRYVDQVNGTNIDGFLNAWFRGTVIPPAQYLHPNGL
jgi:aminopeptidase N